MHIDYVHRLDQIFIAEIRKSIQWAYRRWPVHVRCRRKKFVHYHISWWLLRFFYFSIYFILHVRAVLSYWDTRCRGHDLEPFSKGPDDKAGIDKPRLCSFCALFLCKALDPPLLQQHACASHSRLFYSYSPGATTVPASICSCIVKVRYRNWYACTIEKVLPTCVSKINV